MAPPALPCRPKRRFIPSAVFPIQRVLESKSVRAMTAFHFGSRERRLFGYYEPAPASARKVQAALLCHPMGNEQVFAYRSMRQLAARLVRAGFHVLRFDYFGTGDSYGDTGEGDL